MPYNPEETLPAGQEDAIEGLLRLQNQYKPATRKGSSRAAAVPPAKRRRVGARAGSSSGAVPPVKRKKGSPSKAGSAGSTGEDNPQIFNLAQEAIKKGTYPLNDSSYIGLTDEEKINEVVKDFLCYKAYGGYNSYNLYNKKHPNRKNPIKYTLYEFATTKYQSKNKNKSKSENEIENRNCRNLLIAMEEKEFEKRYKRYGEFKNSITKPRMKKRSRLAGISR